MTNDLAQKVGVFGLRQRVRVKNTEVTAIVQGMLINEAGTQYQISYWHENIRRIEWVLPEELEC